MITRFLNWLEDTRPELAVRGVTVTLNVNLPSGKQSVWVELMSDRALGRLTFWESGEFFWELHELGANNDLLEPALTTHGRIESDQECRGAFSQFLDQI